MITFSLKSIQVAALVGGLADKAQAERPILLSIESPRPQGTHASTGILFKGWAVSREDAFEALRLLSPGEFSIDIELGVARPDVAHAATQNGVDQAMPTHCGFSAVVMPPVCEGAFEWELSAVTRSGAVVVLVKFLGEFVLEGEAAPNPADRSAAALIAGFHRSGTSVLAEVLDAAGVPLGHELVPPLLSNPDGHFEDCWAVDIDSAVLKRAGSDWRFDGDGSPPVSGEQAQALTTYCAARSQESRRWAVKDPRAGHLLEAWRRAEPNLLVVAPVRNPAACASSLRQRQAAEIVRGIKGSQLEIALALWADPDLPYRMWASHHEALLAHARRHPARVRFVEHSRLLSEPEAVIRRLLGPDARLAANPVRQELTGRGAGESAEGISAGSLARIRRLADDLAARGAGCLHVSVADPAKDPAGLHDRLEGLIESLHFSGTTPEEMLAPAEATSGIAEFRLAERVREQQSLGEWNAALTTYSAILASDPVDCDAIAGVAECLLMHGDFDGALHTIGKFLSISPREPWAWQRCGRTVTRLANRDLSTRFSDGLRQCCDFADPNWIGVRSLWEMRRGNMSAADEALGRVEDVHATSLLTEAHVERALRKGDRVAARTIAAAAFSRTHDRDGYRRYLSMAIAQVHSPAMRAALLTELIAELESLRDVLRPQNAAPAVVPADEKPSRRMTWWQQALSKLRI